MVYSATVSQLINSIESHSITFDGHSGIDSIRTQSIANSGKSSNSTASCKSISEPAVLFSKAVLDLKRAAREGQQEDLTEYWDTWNYWKKHPFVIGNELLSGQLLLEHLLILTNLKYKSTQKIFQDIQKWLQVTSTQNTQNDLVQLRDQICAGYFLIFCPSFSVSIDHLNQVKSSLVTEYFDALKSELEKREMEETKVVPKPQRNLSEKLQLVFVFLKEIALNLLEQMKTRYALLVAVIKSNSENFLLFCKKLLQIILRKLL